MAAFYRLCYINTAQNLTFGSEFMQTTITPWQLNIIDQMLINLALEEDLGLPCIDVTTQLLMTGKQQAARARIISKHNEPVIICGLPVVNAIFERLSDLLVASLGEQAKQYTLETNYEDGMVLLAKAELLRLTAHPQLLLMAERCLLNFLQRLSAVATYTAKFVTKIQHTQTRILDTRKTTPGFRHLEKYAVHCGGGVNHRFGLYDAIMIKDTHVDVCGGMQQVLDKLPNDILKRFPVIVEVRDLDELKVVLEHGIHKTSRVLLDNMSLAMMRESVALCAGQFATEASGNISLENVVTVAETGVDFVSIGKLTHSAGSVDLSMQSEMNHV